ncbi:hypothetical protein BC936DRAFT_147841 [Jimgerdemannia flammicorona]|uniref:Uncharacterized protein n=1 Tax=Jimgerdemannia flammicorona TaxID=994334 RepID=A0A433D4F0_9FUNG|nr:hypothetical protein BC936DRAFT_147841 [Jimgerdemannia flammicorona]
MDRRTRTLHVPTTAQRVDKSPISPTRTLLDRPHTACSAGTGSEQSGSPRSSLTGSGRDSTTAVQAVLAMQVFGRWKDAAPSTPLNQSLVKSEADWWRVPNADEEREGYFGVRSYNRDSEATRSVATKQTSEASLRILREASVDLLDSNEEECSPRVVVFRIKDGVVKQRRKRSREFSNSYDSTCSKAAKIVVDSKPLSATSNFLPLPSTDVSPVVQTSFCDFDHIISCIVEEPVVHDGFEYEIPLHSESRAIPLQDTEVVSTDDEERHHSSSKIDVGLLALFNRHEALKTEMGEMKHVLRGLSRWHLGEVDNRMTKFQAAARGYLVRTNPWIRELMLKEEPACARGYIIRKKVDTFWTQHVAASRIQAAWRGFKTRNFLVPAIIFRLLRRRAQRRPLECAPEADNDHNDRVLQLERRMDQEAKSREAMEGRFEEVVDEVRLLQEQVDVMQEEIDLYKEKLETADTEMRASKSAEERRLRKELEQMIVQILPQLVPQLLPQLVVVQHQASSGKPARSSKENSTPPPSNKPAPADPPMKTTAAPPRSRTPRTVAPDRLAAKTNALKVAPDQKAATAGVPSSVLVARASLDKRTVLGPAKATTNVRSGKSTAVRREPKPSLPIKML